MLPPKAIWFITGCSTGIGAALASYVADQGHRVVATARKVESLSYLKDGPDVLKLPLDVCDTASIDAALQAALKVFSRIDVIVNMAGVNTLGIAESIPEEVLRRAMETNFWGPMHVTRKAIGIFRDVNTQSGSIGGTIVNVTSIGGRIAIPAEAGYHASKFALEGFTEAIASEMDPAWKIRMMILEPGGTKSNFVAKSVEQQGPSHPAYGDPNLPVNGMLKALTDPGLNDRLNDASDVAKCLFVTLQQNEEIPLRLVTGADAYAAVKSMETARARELEKWRPVSEAVGTAKIPTLGDLGLES